MKLNPPLDVRGRAVVVGGRGGESFEILGFIQYIFSLGGSF